MDPIKNNTGKTYILFIDITRCLGHQYVKSSKYSKYLFNINMNSSLTMISSYVKFHPHVVLPTSNILLVTKNEATDNSNLGDNGCN